MKLKKYMKKERRARAKRIELIAQRLEEVAHAIDCDNGRSNLQPDTFWRDRILTLAAKMRFSVTPGWDPDLYFDLTDYPDEAVNIF